MKLFIFKPCSEWHHMGGMIIIVAENLDKAKELAIIEDPDIIACFTQEEWNIHAEDYRDNSGCITDVWVLVTKDGIRILDDIPGGCLAYSYNYA